jgi:hypothetical protein
VALANFYGLSKPNILIANVLAFAASGALLYWSYRRSVASRERALELARLTGFDEQLVLKQLTFDGYPLRNPARVFSMRNCKACGALNRGVTREDGAMICSHCGATIPRKGWLAENWWLLLFLLILAIGAAVGYYNGKH